MSCWKRLVHCPVDFKSFGRALKARLPYAPSASSGNGILQTKLDRALVKLQAAGVDRCDFDVAELFHEELLRVNRD